MLQIRSEENDDVLFCAEDRWYADVDIRYELHRVRHRPILYGMRTRRLPSSWICTR